MKSRALLGILIVIVGVFLLLSQTGVYDFGALISNWWPLILIAIGAYSLLVNTAPPAGGILLVFLGVWFLAGRAEFISSDWNKYLFPVLIVIIGLWLLFSKKGVTVGNRDTVKYFAIFSGINERIESKSFKGGSLTAVFGGVELDLAQAQIDGERADMDITAAFGGADVTVPKDWKVEVTGLPLFGGWGNKTRSTDKPEDAPVLRIRCLAMFGGVDIKN